MTEADWGACTTAGQMLRIVNRLTKTANPGWRRKFRLFGCYTLSRLALRSRDGRFAAAVHAAERYFDNRGTIQELQQAIRHAQLGVDVLRNDLEDPHDWAAKYLSRLLLDHPLTMAIECYSVGSSGMYTPDAARLVRDLFGNPFRPVVCDPSWRTSAAVGLAQAMYETCDFAAMPVLADALEEAGCDSADVLAHCRGPGPHVRGCWVVDLVLGKA
jgi:hypothetical protein